HFILPTIISTSVLMQIFSLHLIGPRNATGYNRNIYYPAGVSSELLPEDRGTGYAPAGTLSPNAENISPAAKDLLKRLLQPDPCLRLRSLLSLQRIAFYMGHDLRSYMQKKESPFRLLGRTVQPPQERRIKEFSDFDSSLGDSVSCADD
ncbi:hypothetical protein WH47_01193, partial [Habropoda laboriosa]